MLRPLIPALLLVTATGVLPAQPPGDTAATRQLQAELFHPDQVFFQANEAYQAGDYARAVELYESLLDASGERGHLRYNLGNAYLRAGDLGRAIASYRRAQRVLPRDQDLQANLTFARSSTKDALAPPAPAPVLATLFFWHYRLSRGELAAALLACNLLFWSLLAFYPGHRRSEMLRWSLAALLVLLLATGGSLAVHQLLPRRIAVVLPAEVEARSGTSADAVVRFQLHAGTEVRVVEQRPGWLRIALPDGQQGWIETAQAQVVEL